MQAVEAFKTKAQIKALCDGLDFCRATVYRIWDRKNRPQAPKPKKVFIHPRALKAQEKEKVVEVMNSKRFQDKAPAQVHATLLDEGKYLCSVSTIYRILNRVGLVKERRKRVDRAHYAKPELLATGANQVWSWDITKLKGPVKWQYFYLYVVMDIFSRYVVGWRIESMENATLAKILIEECIQSQNIAKGQLTIHSDRGAPMKSKVVAQLLADLGVIKSLSRPSVSNDNPFSEAIFSTIKGCPTYPGGFGSIEDSRAWARSLFPWYNDEHKHSGIGYYTAQSVHYGTAKEFYELREKTLLEAYASHPERFVNKIPKPFDIPKAVWINPPTQIGGTQGIGQTKKIAINENRKADFDGNFQNGEKNKKNEELSSLIKPQRLSHFG